MKKLKYLFLPLLFFCQFFVTAQIKKNKSPGDTYGVWPLLKKDMHPWTQMPKGQTFFMNGNIDFLNRWTEYSGTG